jgi:hypothetical protein
LEISGTVTEEGNSMSSKSVNGLQTHNTKLVMKSMVLSLDLSVSNNDSYVGFEVFIAVVMKSIIFWDMMPCSLLRCNRRFAGTCRLQLQGRKKKFQLATCLLAGSCWNVFFDPEDGGDTFLRNVGCISTDYMASHPTRRYSSMTVRSMNSTRIVILKCGHHGHMWWPVISCAVTSYFHD